MIIPSNVIESYHKCNNQHVAVVCEVKSHNLVKTIHNRIKQQGYLSNIRSNGIVTFSEVAPAGYTGTIRIVFACPGWSIVRLNVKNNHTIDMSDMFSRTMDLVTIQEVNCVGYASPQ